MVETAFGADELAAASLQQRPAIDTILPVVEVVLLRRGEFLGAFVRSVFVHCRSKIS